MNRILTAIVCGIIVSGFYDPIASFVIAGTAIVGVGAWIVYFLYRNRLKPLPDVKKEDQQLVKVPTMIERELDFVAERIHERAISNGYISTNEVPEKLKV